MKILTALVVLAVLLSVTATLAQPATDPDRPWETWQPPAVTLPNPNAYDTYLKAFAFKDDIDRAHGLPRPKDAPPPPGGIDQWGVGPPEMTLPQRVALYADVFEIAHEALKQECRFPPNDTGPQLLSPELTKFRELARLFAMQSAWFREQGRNLDAANAALDGVLVGHHVATGRSDLTYLVGIACEAIAYKQLDAVIGELNAAECREVLKRLQAVEARRVPMKELLDGEERGQRVMLKWLARMPAGQAGAGGGAPMPPPPPGLEAWPPGGGQEVLRASWPAVGKLFNALREMAKRPYHLREPLPPPDDILMRMTADLYPKLWFSDARARTTPRLRIAALAARCFLLEKGHLPGGLAELAPTYLERLPGDPFYVGPLHSTTADGALVVYSIGPDGADDGGAAIVGTVKIESKGDVVVRVAGR